MTKLVWQHFDDFCQLEPHVEVISTNTQNPRKTREDFAVFPLWNLGKHGKHAKCAKGKERERMIFEGYTPAINDN